MYVTMTPFGFVFRVVRYAEVVVPNEWLRNDGGRS